ncbi:uncharacterized protein LOC132203949 isoform X2 [Neocloeon triangulifer]|nr:uncharacterized protein LOC132203949 isoform X2 [Neocloeon triangulifer]
MRTVISNLPKLDPDSINNLPNSLKTAILEAITELIPRKVEVRLSDLPPLIGLDLAPDSSCIIQKMFIGFTLEERNSLQPDLSTLKQLITSDLQKFDFNVVEQDLTVLSEDSEKIWQCLASSAPYLCSIRDQGYQKPRPGYLIVPYLTKFFHLLDQQLTTFEFSDRDIQVLSTSCPNLKNIILRRNGDLTENGLRSLENLPLEQISIDCLDRRYNPRDVVNPQKAFELLPKLRSIRNWHYPDRFELPNLSIPENPQQRFMLEEVADIMGSLENIGSHLSKLKRVNGSGSGNRLSPEILTQLPHLQSMHDLFLPEDYLALELVGTKLVEVTVSNIFSEHVDLSRIIMLCPNLEKLHLFAYFSLEDQQHVVEPARLKLKDLKLKASVSSDDDAEDPGMIFWDLLLAPNLEKVGLFDFLFTEPSALLDSASPFLQRLTFLNTRFEFKWPTKETKDRDFPQALDIHNELLSGLIRNCPHLQKVRCEIFAKKANMYRQERHHKLLLADVSPEWCRIPKQKYI